MRCVWRAVFVATIAILAGSGCGGAQTPDPSAALARYTAAAENADSAAVYELLSRDARTRYTREDIAALLSGDAVELQERGKSLTSAGATVEIEAELRLTNGQVAALRLEDGRYRVVSAQALPAVATSPVQALSRLRAAVDERDYRALIGLLTAEARTAVEQQRSILLDELDQPSSLSIEVDGDRARVTLPSGREINLKREDGSWRFDDLR